MIPSQVKKYYKIWRLKIKRAYSFYNAIKAIKIRVKYLHKNKYLHGSPIINASDKDIVDSHKDHKGTSE